uniref:Ubiquitin-associated and SH3 domain-containing protein B n=1 Tax=Ascaris suum TaxID=6253 RepID=F1L765_ASCSU
MVSRRRSGSLTTSIRPSKSPMRAIINEEPIEIVDDYKEDADERKKFLRKETLENAPVASKLSTRIANLKLPDDFSSLTVIVVSHGEIIGRTFPNWLNLAFKHRDEQSLTYHPYDLNMPSSIPQRPLSHYEIDSPITTHGKICAALVARGIYMARLKPNMVISSPEMRCVETAWSIWRALQMDDRGICIDEALSEWGEWRAENAEKIWIKPQMLSELKILINNDYKPMATGKIDRKETPLDYTIRLQSFFEYIALNLSTKKCILLVANASALSVLNDRVYTHPMHVQIENENGEMRLCDIRAIEINSSRQVTQLKSPIMPFTRSLHESLMHR